MTINTLNPDRNFIDAIEIANNLNLNYLVLFGSLLGLIRDGKLIDWDKDVDLVCVFRSKKEVDEIICNFKRLGFKGGFQRRIKPTLPALKFHREGGRKIDIEFVYTFEKNCYLEWFSIFVAYDKLGKRTFINKLFRFASRLPFNEGLMASSPYKGKNMLLARFSFTFAKQISFLLKTLLILLNKNQKLIAEIPYDCISEKKNFLYHGKKCLIPKNPECFLVHHYGENWKTPKKSQKWTEYLKEK